MVGQPGTCYKFVQHGASSQNAAIECAVMGGHLARLQTSEEQTKFKEVRRKFGKSPDGLMLYEYVYLYAPVCTCMYLCVPVYTCMYLYVPVPVEHRASFLP